MVGELGEAIAHEHFGGERSSFSAKGWDIRTSNGVRIEVKTVRRTSTTRFNCSPIRGSDYDSALVVVFDDDFNLAQGLKLVRATVEARFPHRKHVNGRIITVTRDLLAQPDVEHVDLTAA